MTVARRMMGKDHPYNDDTVEIDPSITAVYRQRSNYLSSSPAGLGPSINFILFIIDDVEPSVVAESVIQ
jgi:hypothetical protein